MKTTTYHLLSSFVLLLSVAIVLPAFSQSANPVREMAQAGQEVAIVVYPVKADMRQQYEHFVHDILWQGAKGLAAQEQKIFQHTRILHPIQANADGTYSYMFVMDPVVPGGDYYIPSLLKKMFGAEKAKEHYKYFTDTLAGKYNEIWGKQSKD